MCRPMLRWKQNGVCQIWVYIHQYWACYTSLWVYFRIFCAFLHWYWAQTSLFDLRLSGCYCSMCVDVFFMAEKCFVWKILMKKCPVMVIIIIKWSLHMVIIWATTIHKIDQFNWNFKFTSLVRWSFKWNKTKLWKIGPCTFKYQSRA